MKLRSMLLRAFVILSAASVGTVGIATAASASTDNPAPASYSIAHHPGHRPAPKPLKYTEVGGKLDCSTCAVVQRMSGNYQVKLTYTVTKGQIDPADWAVKVTDGKGRWDTLWRTASSVYAGEIGFKPVAYNGLRVTKGSAVSVKMVCTPYVVVSGGLNCAACKAKPGAVYQITLSFSTVNGQTAPRQSSVWVVNGPRKAQLWRYGNVYVGTVSFIPNAYAGLEISNGTSHVGVTERCNTFFPPRHHPGGPHAA